MKKELRFLMAAILSLSLFLTGCGGNTADKDNAAPAGAAVTEAAQNMTVKMLNVGQGDAILIQTPEQTVLIDTSDLDEQDKLRNELQKAGVKRIDKLILTHPHADHIGGVEGVVLRDYEVGEVYDNGMPSKSKIYTRYMKILKQKNIKRHGLAAGDELDFGGGVKFKVYAPEKAVVEKGSKTTDNHDPNNESVVGKLIFGDFSMMFTGDAEKAEEMPMVNSYGKELKSTVLKSGHHGSKTSSSKEFLREVAPEAALISCGTGNDYGHPHEPTMKKYRAMKLKIYETDKNGTITVKTDGKNYTIEPEVGDAQ